MGQVIEFRSRRAVSAPAASASFRCARCGTDLWNLLTDGRVRCADCEQECPLRTVQASKTLEPKTAGVQEYDHGE